MGLKQHPRATFPQAKIKEIIVFGICPAICSQNPDTVIHYEYQDSHMTDIPYHQTGNVF